MQIKQEKTKFFVFKCAVQSLRCVINTKRQVFRSSSLSRLLKGSTNYGREREQLKETAATRGGQDENYMQIEHITLQLDAIVQTI